jgi:hypothetical protein
MKHFWNEPMAQKDIIDVTEIEIRARRERAMWLARFLGIKPGR